MKSAYRLLVSNLTISSADTMSNGWSKIWKLQIPLKVRHLIWRACIGCLPTRIALRSRKVELTEICPLCNAEPEDTMHVFVKCQYARGIWSQTVLGDYSASVQDFISWWNLIM